MTRQVVTAGRDPATVYLGGLAPSGRRIMALALTQFAEIVSDGAIVNAAELDWSRIDHAHTSRAREEWLSRYAPQGARVRLAGVKGALKAAWRLGVIDTDRLLRATDISPICGRAVDTGRALTHEEIAALFRVCAADTRRLRGERDAAVFAIFRSGMRVGELTALDIADWMPGDGSKPDVLRIRHGKGDKGRWAYIDPSVGHHVRVWIELRGSAAGALITPVRLVAPLTNAMVRVICRERAAEAGVPRFTPHDWRRTTATALHDAGAPLTVIRDMLGHTSVSTTERYLRNDREAAKAAAATMLAQPIARRTPAPPTEA